MALATWITFSTNTCLNCCVVNVYSYCVLVKSVSWYCVYGSQILSQMCVYVCICCHIHVYIHGNHWCLYMLTNIGNELCDVALFILKSDSSAGSPAGFITFTEHQLHKVNILTSVKLQCVLYIIRGLSVSWTWTQGTTLWYRLLLAVV